MTLDVEMIDDAVAAVDLLCRTDGVDPRRVVLLGHSIGATFAPALGAPAAYWYELDDRCPVEAGRDLPLPILAQFGGRDYQVTAADAAIWREALAERSDAEVHELPTLDHLFREKSGTATPAD